MSLGMYASAHVEADGFVPPSGNVLWVAADDLSLSDGDPVVTWVDQSGSGNDLTAATTGQRPVYKTSIINSLPVVRFDGVNDHMQNWGFTQATPHTAIMLFQLPNVSGAGAVLDKTYQGYGEGFYRNSDRYIMEGGGVSFSAPGKATVNVVAVVAIHDGASSKFYFNGGTASTGTTNPTTLNGVRFFANRLNQAYQAADAGELFLFDSALGASDLNSVGTYLERWGITWSTIT